MALSTFRERFGYGVLLRHMMTGQMPTNVDIGEAVGRTGQWVTKWSESDTPPKDFEVHRPLAAFLGVDENWLIRGEGEPPMAIVWESWLERRRGGHDSAEDLRQATADAAARLQDRIAMVQHNARVAKERREGRSPSKKKGRD